MISYIIMVQENINEKGKAQVEKSQQAVAEYMALRIYKNSHIKTVAVVRVNTNAKLKADRFEVIYKLMRECSCLNFQHNWSFESPESRLSCADCGVDFEYKRKAVCIEEAQKALSSMDKDEVIL